MAKPLRDRTRILLESPSARLGDLRATLAETVGTLAGTEAAKAVAEDRRINPLLMAEEADKAQADLEEHQLVALQQRRAIDLLKARIAEIEAEDTERQKQKRYDAAKAERDALAAELADRVPALLAELAGYIKRTEASDAEIAALRGAGAGLESAESIARGCPTNFYVGGAPVMRLRDMRVPLFDARKIVETIWPDQAEERSRLQAISDGERANARAARAAREARESAKGRYAVQRPANEAGTGMKRLDHAAGSFSLGLQRFECELYPDQVDAARGKGWTVEPLAPVEAEQAEAAE